MEVLPYPVRLKTSGNRINLFCGVCFLSILFLGKGLQESGIFRIVWIILIGDLFNRLLEQICLITNSQQIISWGDFFSLFSNEGREDKE